MRFHILTESQQVERVCEHGLEVTSSGYTCLECRDVQRRSFAFGNCNIDNQNVTREVVERAASKKEEDPTAT